MKATLSVGLQSFAWLCLGAALALLGGCGNDSPANAREAAPAPAANPTVIKIVSSLPRTGSANAQTTTLVNGIKMAIEEVGGKVGEFTIVYEDWDDASPQRGNWDPAVETAN